MHDVLKGWHGRRGCAYAGGSRGSLRGGGCLAGKYACSLVSPSRSVCARRSGVWRRSSCESFRGCLASCAFRPRGSSHNSNGPTNTGRSSLAPSARLGQNELAPVEGSRSACCRGSQEVCTAVRGERGTYIYVVHAAVHTMFTCGSTNNIRVVIHKVVHDCAYLGPRHRFAPHSVENYGD